jgi:hypothetical protein
VELELDSEFGLVVLLEALELSLVDVLVELEELVDDDEFTIKVKVPVFERLLASPWYVP